MTDHPVVPAIVPPGEPQFRDALVAGLGRAAARLGRGALADKSGRTTKGLDKLFAGSIPTGKGLLDFLLADATALDEVLALYGKALCEASSAAVPDAAALAELAAALSTYATAMADGSRNHQDTLAIAAKLRPLLPMLRAIVNDADRLRGGAR